MSGQPHRSGGHNRRSLAEHRLRRTVRADRVRGYRPDSLDSEHAKFFGPRADPAQAPVRPQQPTREDLEPLGRAGRRFVRQWLRYFVVDPIGAKVLVLAARVEDQLAAVQQVDRTTLAPAPLAALERRERSAIKLQSDLIRQLRLMTEAP
jgi:hypothetical protein